MIDLSTYHEGFVAGFVPGLGLGLGLGLMKMAWEHSERRRRAAALKPDIVPKGQPLRPARIILRGWVFDRLDFNHPRFYDGYQPRPHDDTPNPPLQEP